MHKKSTINSFNDSLNEMATFDLPDSSYEFLLSDDIWNKFELPLDEAGLANAFSDIHDIDTSVLSSLLNIDCEIRNHDCMWAGHCGSKEHPVDEFKQVKPIIHTSGTSAKQATVPAGRSLLLKTQNNHPQQSQQQQQHNTTLAVINANLTTSKCLNSILFDSPPTSDDEETKCKTVTLQLLQEAISECDLEDDSDLYDYFEEEDLLNDDDTSSSSSSSSNSVDVKQQQTQQNKYTTTSTTTTKSASMLQFANDHSYHKDKNASMRANNLGIETPSDSEEEIDVVSLGEKQANSNRIAASLPNNPSSKDRQQLQKTMATAINKNGIKTLFPRTAASNLPPSSAVVRPTSLVEKRRMIDARAIKRTKHHKSLSASSSPYKKRAAYNHSSDSEPEPAEKRYLHNNMERQRRIDLRNAFDDLRMLVPEVSKRERAPKVVILREAAVYCEHLTDVSESMQRQVEEMRRQQKRLRARVSQLRLSLASKHR